MLVIDIEMTPSFCNSFLAVILLSDKRYINHVDERIKREVARIAIKRGISMDAHEMAKIEMARILLHDRFMMDVAERIAISEVTVYNARKINVTRMLVVCDLYDLGVDCLCKAMAREYGANVTMSTWRKEGLIHGQWAGVMVTPTGSKSHVQMPSLPVSCDEPIRL